MIKVFYLFCISLMLIGGLTYLSYIEDRQVVFSCSGIYRVAYHENDNSFMNVSNVLVTVKGNETIELEAHGIFFIDDHLYNINREYEFDYKVQDVNASIIRISLKKLSKGTSDSIPEPDNKHVFSAINGRDSLIRIWKHSHHTILIGSAFTPIFSCTMSQ